MQDVLTFLETLTRPRLLIRAARIGAQDYQRDTRLCLMLGLIKSPSAVAVLSKLIELEATLDDQRRAADAAYSARQHVDVLIAMMGEARLLRRTQDV